MPHSYRGKCPICSSNLMLLPLEKNLRCSVNPKHYRIDKEIFEAAWDAFESGDMRDAGRARLLMNVLISNNTGEEKVNINAEAGL